MEKYGKTLPGSNSCAVKTTLSGPRNFKRASTFSSSWKASCHSSVSFSNAVESITINSVD